MTVDGEAEVSPLARERWEVRVGLHRKSSEVETGYSRTKLGKGTPGQPTPRTTVMSTSTTRQEMGHRKVQSTCRRYLL